MHVTKHYFTDSLQWAFALVIAIVGCASNEHVEDDSTVWLGRTVHPRQMNQALSHEGTEARQFSFWGRVTQDLGDLVEVRHQEGTGVGVGRVHKSRIVIAVQDGLHFKHLLQTDPTNCWALICEGLESHVNGLPNEALSHLNEAVRLRPDGQSFFWRGRLFLERQEYEKAIADLSQALAKEYEPAVALRFRGVANLGMRQLAKAIDDFNGALQLAPGFAAAYAGRGFANARQEHFSEALADFETAIKLDPTNAQHYSRRGLAKEICKQDMNAVLNDYDEAVRIDPNSPHAYTLRGECRLRIKNYAGAIEDFNRAIELETFYSAARFNRGLMYLDAENWFRATIDLEIAVRMRPENASAFSSLALARLGKGDLEEAIRDCHRSIQLDPKNSASRYNLGRIFAAKQEYEAAIESFTAASHLDPKDSFAIALRGVAKHNLKDFAGALEDYKNSLQIDQDQYNAMLPLAYLRTTATDETLHDEEEASRLIEVCLKALPDDRTILAAKACLLAHQGRFSEAITLEKEAMKDEAYAKDNNFYGGVHSVDRIAAWENNQVWLQP